MTFDDGVIKIYSIDNIAKPGEIPAEGLVFYRSFCFSYLSLGVTRYYEALKANQNIESVICVYYDQALNTNQIAVMEDGAQYKIRMIQQDRDENGIRIMKISLERSGEQYEYKT